MGYRFFRKKFKVSKKYLEDDGAKRIHQFGLHHTEKWNLDTLKFQNLQKKQQESLNNINEPNLHVIFASST